MKKSLIIISLIAVILSGLTLTTPSVLMGAMHSDMGNMGNGNDCIGHCLKTIPFINQNSVTLPLILQILGIFIGTALSIAIIYRFYWIEDKISKLNQLFLFETVFLKE